MRMVVDQLEVELVRENPGQVHPEQALRRHFDAAIRPTAAIVKEGHGRPAGHWISHQRSLGRSHRVPASETPSMQSMGASKGEQKTA